MDHSHNDQLEDTLTGFARVCSTAQSPDLIAVVLMSIIDCAPDQNARAERLRHFTRDWPEPGRFARVLKVILSSPVFPEDAKVRVLTMGRPGPEDVRSFVLNRPMLAAEMLLAVMEAHASPSVKEFRMLCLGFSKEEVVTALMREARQVREPIISELELAACFL